MHAAAVVRFHGTRGSVPTPEPANAGCGGNTSSIEVVAPGGVSVLLDAGTGIRSACRDAGDAPELDIVLTHFHWDHVQGLPFFAPLHDPRARIRIHAPCQAHLCVRDLLGGHLAPVYFPAPFDDFAARITLHDLEGGVRTAAGVEIEAMRVQHPSNTQGLLLRGEGWSMAYVPDNELGGDASAYEALRAFVADADLLVHDAMLTEAEYEVRRGWGHSTFEQAVRFAGDAGVGMLRLFHHHPDRPDSELERMLAATRHELERCGSLLDVDLAREGETVTLPRTLPR
jgi:phosphoribosyl 1,2-cyclic phosphodiesterase